MATLTSPRSLDKQTLMWDEIAWDGEPMFAEEGVFSGTSSPARTISARSTSSPASPAFAGPYWAFTWQWNATNGLLFTDVTVKDTLGVGSGNTEPVADRIDFTDFQLAFNDMPAGTFETFNLAAAFAHPESRFEFRERGTRFGVTPNDPLFQYGLYLKLVQDFGGTCKVTLVIATVFRGASNDFDPGGMAWALKVFPQIGWTWEPTGSTGRGVRQFRGSVRVIADNKLTYMPHAVSHGSSPPPLPNENVASFFADSNTSMANTDRAMLVGQGSGVDTARALGAYASGNPFGWGMVFDYNRLNVSREEEYPAVWGPYDALYNPPPRTRRNTYEWPAGMSSLGARVSIGGFRVEKEVRQGYYDNVHLHAKMPRPDSRGNLQIHAPFCGHSCVHMHWRWSNVSSNGAIGGRGWQYKGWSMGASPVAYSRHGAPLIPPNQKLTVALCLPTRTRHSNDHIVNAAALGTIDPLKKMLWYWADVFSTDRFPINAREQQVILEHGLGWAYRYALPGESNTSIGGLIFAINDTLPWTGTPTNVEMMEFFERYVYPQFRYYDAVGLVVNQVPEGTYDTPDTAAGGTAKSLEQL